MGGLLLRRLMSMDRHRRRRRCKIQARNGPITSRDKRNGSPCQEDGSCQIGETKGRTWPYLPEEDDSCQTIGETEGYTWPYLPEDILRLIHSLMPLRDAARAACACRAFLCSWRSFPDLTFSNQTLGLNENARGKDEIAREFTSRVDRIMKNNLGTGVKTLKLLDAPNHNGRCHRRLDSWLEKAITPGIEELTLALAEHFVAKKYNFPCSVLSRGNGDSIRHLSLNECAFRPTVGFGCLRSLATLDLFSVYIKGDELGCLLSNSLALESLDLSFCREIVHVKIPCLQRLNHLSVTSCRKLQVIESKAPNLSSFHFESGRQVQLSLGKALQVKKLYIDCSDPVCYSRAELASSTQNLEAAGIRPSNEMVNTPLVSGKFLCLECLSITLRGSTFSQSFDYFSMVSSPSLEAFILDVSQLLMEHPIYDETCFCSLARTWVYLTCHMLRAWLG